MPISSSWGFSRARCYTGASGTEEPGRFVGLCMLPGTKTSGRSLISASLPTPAPPRISGSRLLSTNLGLVW